MRGARASRLLGPPGRPLPPACPNALERGPCSPSPRHITHNPQPTRLTLPAARARSQSHLALCRLAPPSPRRAPLHPQACRPSARATAPRGRASHRWQRTRSQTTPGTRCGAPSGARWRRRVSRGRRGGAAPALGGMPEPSGAGRRYKGRPGLGGAYTGEPGPRPPEAASDARWRRRTGAPASGAAGARARTRVHAHARGAP